jgi:RNA polymerase sigma-54 factor
MALGQRFEFRLGQSLVMTPQLQQAIKLLQMPNLELAAFVEEQIEKNPLLEQAKEEPAADEWAANEGSREDTGADPAIGAEGLAAADQVLKADDLNEARQDAIDADPQQIYPDDSDFGNAADGGAGLSTDWSSRAGGSSGPGDPPPNLEGLLSEQVTLREHLVWQLQTGGLGTIQRAIGVLLIESLDEAGYLTEDVAEIAARAGAGLDEIEEVLTYMQGFEPTGVFSRSLAECLSLQLQERGRLDPAMQALMRNLERLARKDFAGLAELCGVGADEVMDMAREIRELNPRPGLAFARELVQAVVPDVFVSLQSDGWRIELNSDTLPKVLVNQAYYAKVARSAKDRDAKSFIDNCFTEANWLVKSLDQRARTILKVVTEIVRQQEGFLLHGVHRLKPLNLKAVADAVGIHESTVSRVTSNKYAATPRGIFELKYFFCSAIASSDGGPLHSAEAVRHRIKKMIDEENPNAVLSDDRIVEILRASDIDIARRTIVKYREVMKIPSSVHRRRLKAWSGAQANDLDAAPQRRESGAF